MRCKKSEKYLLRSFDDRLSREEKDRLNTHLKKCPLCQERYREYQSMLQTLRSDDFPEPKPYFWERLQPRLKEERRYGPWPLWKLWGIRTLPVSLLLIAALTVTALFFLPAQQEELSQSGILLRNQNPFEESLPLLAEEGIENPNMMLIFTSLSETSSSRRYIP